MIAVHSCLILILTTVFPSGWAAAASNFSSGEQWIEFGYHQKTSPTITSAYMQGNGVTASRLVVINNPVTNQKVLPFHIPNQIIAQNPDVLITATPGEYEPASFVIQAGNASLNNVSIEVTPLISTSSGATLNSQNIDIRVVKAWFQSSVEMRRNNREQQRILVPELLLHDDSLVKVDFSTQTNKVRHNPNIEDSHQLVPFRIKPNNNKQIWITAKIPDHTEAGEYAGEIRVNFTSENNARRLSLPLKIEVLPFKLAESPLIHGKFYLARLVDYKKINFNARGKNRDQMLRELIDMREHGTNVVSVDHNYDIDTISNGVFKKLLDQLNLIKQAGMDQGPVIYVDWRVRHYDNSEQYQHKLNLIRNTFAHAGIDEYLIYNRDEKKLYELKNSKHTFKAAHNIKRKNIVAVTNPSIALSMKGYLDYALVQNSTRSEAIDRLKAAEIIPIAYGIPHAGEEMPANTRYTYGVDLIKKGFAGTLSYAYQSGDCWDDWMHWEASNYRPNVMAYPTVSEPIPTIQWEAWREANDDLKYIATLSKLTKKKDSEILAEIPDKITNNPDKLREHIIAAIVDLTAITRPLHGEEAP